MGEIVFWVIIRTAIVIPVIWLIKPYMDYGFWWTVGILLIYGAIIHPAVVKYKHFEEESQPVLEGTLCSKCKHFDGSAVLCMLYDEHPTEEYIPCGGNDWEPK